jgi:hypothetical protein
MYYVADWGWHIKSPEPSEFLQNLMWLTNPWRMSLLFFVSGAALFFASRKISPGALVKLRNKRLLLPLLFGMAVIVPPQLYVELVTSEGMAWGYGTFYATYLDVGTEAYPQHQHGPLGLWTWNHLWFLAYLWVYTLVFVLIKPLLDRAARRLRDARPGSWTVLLLPVVMLTAFRLLLAEHYPPNNALFGDWYNHSRYFAFLCGGYLLADCVAFWSLAARHCWRFLAAAFAAYASVLMIVNGLFDSLRPLPEEGPGLVLVRVLASFDQWLWILAVLGLGHRYLNRPGAVLRYMNDAILPWYMLHQTLIILFAFWLLPLALPRGLESVVLVLATVVGCALGYELVRRFRAGRLLFGLKVDRESSASALPGGPAASAL